MPGRVRSPESINKLVDRVVLAIERTLKL